MVEQGNNFYSLTFDFDTACESVISFFFKAVDRENEIHNLTENIEINCKIFKDPLHFQVSKSKNQVFPLNCVSLTTKYIEDLIDNCPEGAHHLIIRIEAYKPRKNDLLMNYLKFERTKSSDKFIVKVLRQKVEVDEYAYNIVDIYISDKLMEAKMPEVKDAKEEHLCIICFSEIRNLVNLPCGHSCIGDACVKIYFENGDSRACPLCRKDVDELVCLKESGIDFEKVSQFGKIPMKEEKKQMEEIKEDSNDSDDGPSDEDEDEEDSSDEEDEMKEGGKVEKNKREKISKSLHNSVMEKSMKKIEKSPTKQTKENLKKTKENLKKKRKKKRKKDKRKKQSQGDNSRVRLIPKRVSDISEYKSQHQMNPRGENVFRDPSLSVVNKDVKRIDVESHNAIEKSLKLLKWEGENISLANVGKSQPFFKKPVMFGGGENDKEEIDIQEG